MDQSEAQKRARALQLRSWPRVVFLVLALLGGTAPGQDGAPQEVENVKKAEITRPDGVILHLLGGCWLSDSKCLSTAQELVALRAEVASLKAAPPAQSSSLLLGATVSAVVGILLGVLAGWAAARAWGR